MARRVQAEKPSSSQELRERLLDGAERCFERYGVVKTTMDDIAAAAGVSRATVYRNAAGRDDLILGVLLRSADRFFERLGRRLDRGDQPIGDRLVDGVLYAVDQVRSDEHLALLFTPEAAGVTGRLVGASEALFAQSTAYLEPLLVAAQQSGDLRADLEADALTEWLIRIILSLLTVHGPRSRTRAQTRALLEVYMLPALVAD
jgi:AcrR family transcriptional regulator